MKKPNLALRVAVAHFAAGLALLTSEPPALADIALTKAAEQPAEPTSQPRRQAPASEPAPTDAWGQAIRRGAKQEGIKTDEQKAEEEAEEAKLREESLKLLEERLKLRWSVYAGVGVFAGVAETDMGNTIYIDGFSGPEFAFGAGLRKGISRLWDFQARASLSLAPAPDAPSSSYSYGSSPSYSTYSSGALMLVPGADATFRVHFGESSPWFFGSGARLGGVVTWGTLLETRSNSVSETPEVKLAPLVQALFELGVLVGDHIELSVRPSAGMAFVRGATPAGGVVVGGGYVF